MGKSAKIAKINFRECDGMNEDSVVMSADYIFGDSHSDSNVSWLLRKLERYQNDSSFTSNSYRTTENMEDTATSRLISVPPADSNSSTWKIGLLKVDSDAISGISVTNTHVPFNGVSSPKLNSDEIGSICRRLIKGVILSLYDKYQNHIDEKLSVAHKITQVQYRNFDETILRRLPFSSNKQNKLQ